MPNRAEKLVVSGRVQGVGFRPFVYRTAVALGLTGWVRNAGGEVRILVQGPGPSLDTFARQLVQQAPPLARPVISLREPAAQDAAGGFSILASDAQAELRAQVPPDLFACDDCLRELADPDDRRYRYPFINCTQCGPRYTLIESLPYDRVNTSMSGFAMCGRCLAEYRDPADRRFHAEPVACPECGPQLEYRDHAGNMAAGEQALQATLQRLRAGEVVAVRGIGGYHLLCDATSEDSVARLRSSKCRPHKPLAVMVPQQGSDGCDALRGIALLDDPAVAAVTDPRRPIVLVSSRPDSGLAPSVAPGLREVGVFLPYSPLHHLLLNGFGAPMVATSANLSGEPVLTDPGEVERRLSKVASAYLHHNRPILRPADDAVMRIIAGAPRPLRPGRGSAPLELELPLPLSRPLIAVGGHMKNTVALAWERRVVVSPHIGDLDSPRSLAVFEQVIGDLQRLYRVQAEAVVCDAHPGYASHRWARGAGLPLTTVFHHHAHAAAVYGEHGCDGDILVFTWDGTGYGEDGSAWGGEGLAGRPGAWRRVNSWLPLRLPGGDRAGREPWRAAAAMCWATGRPLPGAPDEVALARQAWEKDINCVTSSAVGRLFDAASSLTGLCHHASFEGQGPMLLEAAADPVNEKEVALPVMVDDPGVERADWRPLLELLLDDSLPVARRASRFHGMIAATLLELALRWRKLSGIHSVGLSGGVFQNRLLTETVTDYLTGDGFRVLLPREIPCNDAGICYGQVIEAAGAAARR